MDKCCSSAHRPFAGNVIDNIAVGEFVPNMERVVEICKSIGILSFIEQLPNGFNTYLGEHGASLSEVKNSVSQ